MKDCENLHSDLVPLKQGSMYSLPRQVAGDLGFRVQALGLDGGV